MSTWRVIITDSEGLTGVAPVCPQQTDYVMHSTGDGYLQEPADEHGIYDCCPGPHLECGFPGAAREIAEILTRANVEVCS